jgi:hypothetical protein
VRDDDSRPTAIAHPPELPLFELVDGATHMLVESHTFGDAHWDDVAQTMLHDPLDGLHVNGAHSVGVPVPIIDDVPSVEHVGALLAGAHVPIVHTKPVAQSVLTAHVVAHFIVEALHARLCGHAMAAPGTHSPLPSQLLSVSVAAEQAVAHTVVPPG